MPTDAPFRLDPELIRFMTGGLSINTGSGRPDGPPSQCRTHGCRVDPGGRRVTVFLPASQAADLLRDVRHTGAIAVVFSEPPTHRTVQIKGRDARVEPLADGDAAQVAAYRTAFVQCLLPLGFTEPMVRALLGGPDADLVAVGFTPEAAVNQTPGAQAGSALARGSW
jgi:hypothetical protein